MYAVPSATQIIAKNSETQTEYEKHMVEYRG